LKTTISIHAVFFDFDGTLAKLNINFPLMRQAVLDLVVAYGAPLNGLSNLYVLEMIKAAQELISKNIQEKRVPFWRRQSHSLRKSKLKQQRKGNS
jgi:phosphoglycolate phosphatase